VRTRRLGSRQSHCGGRLSLPAALASIGTTAPTVIARASAVRFRFKVTLKRSDLAQEVASTREPRRLPVVLSPEELGRRGDQPARPPAERGEDTA
jgi:hypothetical protein